MSAPPIRGSSNKRGPPPLQSSLSHPDLNSLSYQRGSVVFQHLLPPARVCPPTNKLSPPKIGALNNEDNHSDLESDTESWDSFDDAKLALLDKASRFTLEYDADRGYRGTSLQFCSFRRPHMRAFHASWICLFTCALVQFSHAPLLAEIQDSLELSKSDIWWTNLWMMVGGIPMRFILGAMCDVYGARTMMALMLAGSAVPCALTGLVASNLTRLTLVRTVLGAMDAFVPGQYWITCQFVREVAGTAMAITGGLGALGSGVTQLLVGSMIFPWLLEWSNDREWAWRLSLVFPAALALVVAAYVFRFSDDCPLGQISEVKRAGLMMQRSAVDSFRSGVYNLNSWILFVQFAASCGVDFTMCNGAAMFFHYQFHQSTAASGAYAFVYGISAIFARGLGGWISDKAYDTFSLRGRLFAQLICLTMQGLTNVWFARTKDLGQSLVIMIIFSIFVQMSMGTCYGIVSYVDSANTGSVAGIVGAGGSVGAALLACLFMTVDYADAMEYMGWSTVFAAFITPLIVVKGYRGIWLGEEHAADSLHRKQQSPLIVPGKVHHSPHLVSLRARQYGKK